MPAQLPQTAPIPARTAWLLIAVVVLAHMLTLGGVASNLRSPGELSTRVFSTRSIQIRPVAAPPAALPRRPISRTPPPRPAPPPKRPVRPKTDGVLAAATRPPDAVPVPPPSPVLPDPVIPLLPEPPVAVAEPATVPDPVPAAPAPVEAASPAQAEPPAPVASAPAPATITASTNRALTIPGSIRLAFDAVGKRGRLDYKALGELTWLQDGDSYQMRLEMGDWIIGKRVLSSTGKLTGDGLAPTRFSDKFRSERAAHFDRQQGRIIFSTNTPQAALLPGAQDQLSIFAQLAALVAGDPLAFPIGTTLTIQTAGPRDAEPWVFTVEREQMLYLPGGQVPALKLVRKPNKDYGQTVEVWLAPELAFLPARIRITFENGDYLDQQWKSSSPP